MLLSVSCQENENDYHFKEMFPFFQGLDSLAELDKPNEFEKSLACNVHFGFASQETLSHAKKINK